MSNNYFIWVIPGELFPHIGTDGGVSSSYILPNAQAPAEINDLIASSVLIVLRTSEEDVLFARIHISQIEQFDDGLNSGDYILSVDQSKSYRVIGDLNVLRLRKATNTTQARIGISRMDETIAHAIEQETLNKVPINFRPPSGGALQRIPTPSIFGSAELVANRYIAAVASSLPLDEVWGTPAPYVLSPFANFAATKLKKQYGHVITEDVREWLICLDPTAVKKLSTNQLTDVNAYTGSIRHPRIDIELKTIDATKIYARKYIASEDSKYDMGEMLAQTERAEKRHQDILRDVTLYIQNAGITPLQSRSIDLSVDNNGRLTIFEIKTISTANVLNQTGKGIFQLLCYRAALAKAGMEPRNLVLILESPDSEEIENFVLNILDQINIKVLFYNITSQWPSRLKGLIEYIRNN